MTKLCISAHARNFVNLTPRPLSQIAGTARKGEGEIQIRNLPKSPPAGRLAAGLPDGYFSARQCYRDYFRLLSQPLQPKVTIQPQHNRIQTRFYYIFSNLQNIPHCLLTTNDYFGIFCTMVVEVYHDSKN